MTASDLSADIIIETLGLEPHPKEGGFFREVYRASETLAADAIAKRYGGDRRTGTGIYYLLTPETYSHLHQVKSDELFHFYIGDPVEMLQLHPDGRSERVVIGPNLLAGERPLVPVPAGVWQGCRLVPGGTLALMGCTVSPGFEYDDYVHGERAALTERYPNAAAMIEALTEPA